MIHVPDLAPQLSRDGHGLWVSPHSSEVSHPDEWQAWYLAVEDSSYWFRHRAACIVACLERFPPDGPVFDVGGGNGHVSLALKEAGYEPVLVEPSLPAALNAQRRGLEPIICSTLQDAGFRPGSAAAIGSFDVLEHVEDDLAFLALLHRLLRPGGRLLLTVPAFNLLWSGHDEYVGHYRRYSLRQLTSRLGTAGFAVELATYLYCVLPLPIFLRRSIPSRLGWMKSSSFEQFQRDHATERGVGVRVVEWVLRRELELLRAGRTVPIGSSCLVVAQKREASHAARRAA